MSVLSDLLLKKWQTEYKKEFPKLPNLFVLEKVGRNYAYLLMKKIFELTDGEISIAGSNIYPMLTQLEKDNLLVSKLDENYRKFFQLSENGREF